jgi:hypothetical protein
MHDDRTSLVRDWISSYTPNPHPDLGRDGVVCPFMVRTLRREYVTIGPFDAASGGESGLIALAKQLRDRMIARSPELGSDRIYLVSLIVPHGLPDHDLAAMVGRAHAAIKPEFIDLGFMAGDFWPNHDTVGLHSDSFRPFASPVPILGMRPMVPADLMFFVKHERTALDRLTQLDRFRKVFAGQLNDYWSHKLDEAYAATRLELAQP